MLSDHIKKLRNAKGLSQTEVAIKLNVVRQTVSKWENGLSVPDSQMLLALADIFEVSVSDLLGEIDEEKNDDIKVIAEKLEIINLQLAKKQLRSKKIFQMIMIIMLVGIIGILMVFYLLNGSYLRIDHQNLESAIAVSFIHGFEWIFVRVAPIVIVVILGFLYLVNKTYH
ncbi:MAG: helix-turn-helix domain-containing protein [Erysipelotrichaceae bacterium]|nr:helix-turn-helix domain-containing protein [Erysipelotrichaceae bacterium]MDY5251932.1 helix-turn-helix domain-containing protein [Erysipelotrichaceae bacterium]